jgi:uncharacterized OsmC-like protein
MGFLQRTAVNVAVILPLIGAAGCICYVVAKHLTSNRPPIESLPLAANAAPRTAKTQMAIEAQQVRLSSEIAAEAYRRALALRDANAGPMPATSPIPRPRPKNLSAP